MLNEGALWLPQFFGINNLMIATITKNLYINQGSTFSASIAIKDDDGNPVDLTNYSIRSEFRKTYTSSTAYALMCNYDGDPEDGVIELSMPASETRLITAGRYLYDVEIYTNYADNVPADPYDIHNTLDLMNDNQDIDLTGSPMIDVNDDDIVYRVVEGTIEVSAQVTRSSDSYPVS